MHIIDIFILVPILWGIYKGLVKGLVIEISSLAGLLLATYAAVKFSDVLSVYLKEEQGWESEYLSHVVFALLFIIVLILVYLLSKWLTHILGKIKLGWLNKLSGAAFGALKFAFIISVLIFVVNAVNEKETFLPDEMKEKSLLYKPVGKLSEWMLNYYHSSDMPNEVTKILE
jgi:membrane protein required for colicin V production